MFKTRADIRAVCERSNVSFARLMESTRSQYEGNQVLCIESKTLSEVSCFVGLNKEGSRMWNVVHVGLHQGW